MGNLLGENLVLELAIPVAVSVLSAMALLEAGAYLDDIPAAPVSDLCIV
jgi:hypothetical protein